MCNKDECFYEHGHGVELFFIHLATLRSNFVQSTKFLIVVYSLKIILQ